MIKTIGNTPLIKIKYEYEGKTNYIYTKLESYNSVSYTHLTLPTT